MATIEELHAALIKADAAGDTQGAKMLADHIRSLNSAQAPQQASTPQQAPSMLDDAWDGVKNLGLGLAKGVMTPIDGGAQLLSNGLSSAAHAIAPGSGVDQFLQDQVKQVSDINTDRENKYQALTPGSIAAGVGNVLGQVAMPLKGTQFVNEARAAAKAAQLAPKISIGAKLADGATMGAAVGATQPVYNAGDVKLTGTPQDQAPTDYWNEKAIQTGLATAFGGVLSGAGGAVTGAINTLRPLISPKSAVGNQLLNGLAKAKQAQNTIIPASEDADVAGLMGSHDPQDVLARLKAATPLVDGSLPTTAQVAGVPELVQAEKALKNNPAYSGAFVDRAVANNKARLTQLLTQAQTPEALAAAIKNRSDLTKPLYESAKTAVLPVDDELQALLNRPSAKQAISRGQKLAAERGEPLSPTALTQSVDERQTPSTILDANGKPFVSVAPGIPEIPRALNGNMLQYMKMGLEDLQSDRTGGMGSHEADALENTQNQLKSWILKNSPDYAQADQLYAQHSQPINTMETAQDLYKGLVEGQTLNVSHDATPTLSQYRTQLAKALKNAEYGIEPEAETKLKAIQQDLQRESISNSLKFGGADTYFNSQAPNWLSGQLFGKELDGKSMLGRVLGATGGASTGGVMGMLGGGVAAQKIGQFVGNRVNGQFQKAMLDPDYFAKLLADALKRQSADPTALQKLSPVGTRAATTGVEGLMSPN